MNKDEIMHKFNTLLDDTISEGDKESMEISREMFKKAVMMLASLDAKKASEFVECFDGNLKYYNYLTENEAMKIADSFVNQDGSRGAKWRDMNDFFKAVDSIGGVIDNEPNYNRYALFITANKFASDHDSVIQRLTGGDREKYLLACYEFAVTQLEDKDKPYWVRWYFGVSDKF